MAKFRLELLVAVCCAAGIVLLGAVLLRGITGARAASDFGQLTNFVPAPGMWFASSDVAVTPDAGAMIAERPARELANMAAYVAWHKTLSVESSPFRTANQTSSLLRASLEHPVAEVM